MVTKSAPPPEKWLRRGGVARRLGRSKTYVRALEDRGELHPKIGPDRVRLFDPREVDELAARLPERPRRWVTSSTKLRRVDGRLAAECFKLFEAGTDLRRIVMQLEIPISLARELWREWNTSFADGSREETRAKAEAEERAAQREHDRRVQREEHRRHQLKLAQLRKA